MTSLEEKAAGAVAWGLGNYTLAIEKFTAALDAEKAADNDSTFLKTVYSNRSAAYMKTHNKSAALLDADKCVEIDSNWPKGYIRKGDALFSMAKYTEAYNAYNAAHRMDTSDNGVKNKCNLAEKAIHDSATASSSAPSASSATSRPASYLTSFQPYIRLFVIMNAVAYFCSALLAPSVGRFCYRNFVFASIADYLLAVYTAHGLPKFNMEYAQRLLLDPSSMYLFLSLLLVMQRPSSLAMAPLFLTALVHSTHYMHAMVERKSPDTLAQVAVLVNKYLPSAMKQTQETWDGMTTSAKWRVFDQQLLTAACYCEVMQGLAFLVQLLFPSRNFLSTMMWWQYLQMRYMMDQGGTLKAAFSGVNGRITTMLEHRFCPQLLSKGYGMVTTFLANKVKLPEPGEPAPSMSSMIPKCTVM
jgi:stress-induced-phosphoprotein 1